jgi:hypothetical protein
LKKKIPTLSDATTDTGAAMDITLTTPALLFPTVSLLLLAYTNRFLALAALIRDLRARYTATREEHIIHQIANLRRRVLLIRDMQGQGIASLLLCVVCMFLLFLGYPVPATYVFGASLILLMISLGYSIAEIRMSVGALDLALRDLEHDEIVGETRKRGKVPKA